jgi:hypothetical protein
VSRLTNKGPSSTYPIIIKTFESGVYGERTTQPEVTISDIEESEIVRRLTEGRHS